MTRPRLGRRAMDALYAQATAEHAALEEEAAINRINELGGIARLALMIQSSRSPQTHPGLGELMARKEACDRARPRKPYAMPPAMKS
ncbi:MAG TPA: hypothetical protein PLO65_04490 [Caulobacter sp.]|nr:hypothetical protein [Caulobacter sp.]